MPLSCDEMNDTLKEIKAFIINKVIETHNGKIPVGVVSILALSVLADSLHIDIEVFKKSVNEKTINTLDLIAGELKALHTMVCAENRRHD